MIKLVQVAVRANSSTQIRWHIDKPHSIVKKLVFPTIIENVSIKFDMTAKIPLSGVAVY